MSDTPTTPPMEGGKKRSAWMRHVTATMKANKGKSFKQILTLAGKTYKKSMGGGAALSPSPLSGGKKTRRASKKSKKTRGRK